MNTIRSKIIVAVGAVGLLAGCASVLVQDNAIEDKTASALGIAKGTFTIADRQDDGPKSTYLVKTGSGKAYNCEVFGVITVTGRVLSDPVCREMGKTTSATQTPCNALLKAAGKCS